MMNEYWFYDTSSLLLNADNLFNEGHPHFIISSITLNELENIKSSSKKDSEIKASAQKVLRKLSENTDKYEVWVFQNHMLKPIEEKDLEITPDTKILSCAIDYDKNVHPDETYFITNDLALARIANMFFGEDSIYSIEEDEDDYCGYKVVTLNEMEMAEFYQNKETNQFQLEINEYIIIKDQVGNVVDRLCWTGCGYRPISFATFDSRQFGPIKPFKGDTEQQLAFDSLVKNKITMLTGPAGSGKSYVALGYLFNQLEKGKIDRIIVFCNPVAARGAAKLGFYPGDRETKLMDSQVGNMLSAKLGSRIALEQLIDNEQLVLLPFSDIRGYDTTGMKAGVYITEAQNLDVNLMKLALQRIGEDSICIIDGDNKQQLDMDLYAGPNNGMARVSKVFRGHSIYGEVELTTIHRSEIGQIADKM